MMGNEMSFIKSPLNYTGNKYRLLQQILPYFPKNINHMVDLFSGGATVGLNTHCNKVTFVDNNKKVIGLLKFLAQQNPNELLSKLEEDILRFNLSYSYKFGYSKYRCQCSNIHDNNGLKDYNKAGFYQLRDYYNSLKNKETNEAYRVLYLLMVYGFNNDIRFNSQGLFNLPIGKTDLNKMNVNKLIDYITRINEIEYEFVTSEFNSKKIMDILETADFIYMDPPYLISDAVYNSGWTERSEYGLLGFIDKLILGNKRFALSNVLEKKGKVNVPLKEWTIKNADKIELIDIDYNYRSASYNKIVRDANEREILIVNKVYDDKY